MFSDLVDMIDHKKYYCKLRFTCKCDISSDHDGFHGMANGCGGAGAGAGGGGGEDGGEGGHDDDDGDDDDENNSETG